MRLLFVKLKNIGDALLLTPTLTAVREHHPAAEIEVLVRAGTEGILAGCPAIDRIHTTSTADGDRRNAAWSGNIQLLSTLRKRRFDHVFELGDNSRGRWISLLCGARRRTTSDALNVLSGWWRWWFHHRSDFRWFDRHRVEKDFQTVACALPLGEKIPPLAFAAERTRAANMAADWDSFAVIHPCTRWEWKQWPVDRWIALNRHLQDRHGLKVVVSCGPAPEEVALAGEICSAMPDNSVSTGGHLDWAQLADLLHRARLFVGVDTAAMHLAAACDCPTVALFGPSKPSQWAPWRVEHRLITSPHTPGIGVSEKAIPRDAEPMRSVTLQGVLEGCDELLAKGTGR